MEDVEVSANTDKCSVCGTETKISELTDCGTCDKTDMCRSCFNAHECVEQEDGQVDEEPVADADADSSEPDDSDSKAIERKLEHYNKIVTKEMEVMIAKGNWESFAESARMAKKRFENLNAELLDLIHEGPDMQMVLPFAGGKSDNTESDDGDSISKEYDEWLDVPVEEALKLTNSQLEKLHESGVKTLKDLEDLRAREGLRSIKGFGDKAVDSIENQIIEYLASMSLEDGDENEVESI